MGAPMPVLAPMLALQRHHLRRQTKLRLDASWRLRCMRSPCPLLPPVAAPAPLSPLSRPLCSPLLPLLIPLLANPAPAPLIAAPTCDGPQPTPSLSAPALVCVQQRSWHRALPNPTAKAPTD